ncbi:hypothetical protein [uncultured Arcobacter sp.]|uniref:hypothetical protein n=1 Tax=uncultured Arcobacter sp. TaxID=165434 RepID=UPI00261F2847|nr:hypothetical protein [uncultured Arcobacter sp.]
MSYIYYQVELYKRITDGDWNSTGYIISDTFNKNIRLNTGTSKDSFQFSVLNNYNKLYTNGAVFENTDKIKIYGVSNSQSVASSDLLIDGVIQNVDETLGTSNMVTVQGKSRTEQLLEGIGFITSNTLLSPPNILKKAFVFHNSENPNFQITWSNTNSSTKEDGSAFPTYQIAEYDKPMKIIFERYSSDEYTKDGNYYYYINNNNEMIWKKKINTNDFILEETDTQSIKLTNKKDNIINSLRIHCGTDANNVGIRVSTYDQASRSKYGAKWKFVDSTSAIAQNLMGNEIQSNASSFDRDEDGWYPSDMGSPWTYTTVWKSTKTDGNNAPNTTKDNTLTITGTSYSDFKRNYNYSVRREAKWRGQAEGANILLNRNESLIKATVKLPFTT